jgi:hypothetical protein
MLLSSLFVRAQAWPQFAFVHWVGTYSLARIYSWVHYEVGLFLFTVAGETRADRLTTLSRTSKQKGLQQKRAAQDPVKKCCPNICVQSWWLLLESLLYSFQGMGRSLRLGELKSSNSPSKPLCSLDYEPRILSVRLFPFHLYDSD